MLRSPVLAASCLLVLLPPLLATAGEPTSTTNAWARLDAEGFTVQRAADGTLRRMLGGAFELLSEDELVSLDARRDQRALVMAIEKLLTGPSGLLGLEADELRLTTSGPHPFGRSGLIVHHELVHDDVPVFGARVTTVLRGGRLTYLGRVGALPTTAATPSIGATTATSTTLRAAGLRPIGLMRPAVTDLYWKPVDDGHRLAWRVSVLAADTRRHHVGWVDALDGSLLELADATVEGCLGPAPAEAAGRVLGGVLPHGPDDDERLELLPSIEVGGVVAGLDGHFVDPALPTTVGLSGPVVNVDCVACTDPEHPAASVGADGDVSFGTGGSDTMGNGFASRADRTCYFHSEAARRQATRWLDLTWLDEQLQVDTNLPGNCNAYWNGTSLNFFQASDRCANAGEIQDVISHEWGHGLDTNDGLPSSPLSVDAATGEAVADIVAMLRSHDSCLGEGFFRSAADWPSADCSGVRELDEHAPGHVRGMPATLTVDNATTECPPSATYRGPLGAEGHCEGEIFGQAFWRLVQVLATGLDADGSPVAGGTALGEDVAWQVAERLFHDSRPLLASYAPSHLQSIGTSAHDAFLLVDDVGDGVADGTPHSWAIHAAFERHGMTEIGSMPLAEDGCTVPVTALSANAVFDTATGRPLVRLSWTAGADEVELLRSSEERDGFLLISDPLPPGSDMLVDRGVLGGRDYRYALVTVDATGCRSEPSIVTVTTPTAIMDVTGVRVDDTTTGDADGLLGVDEEVELFVTVANLSDAPLTGVTLGLDADAGFTLLAGGPFATADLAPGESRELAMAFRLRSDLLPPRVLRLPFTLEAAEGCLRADRLLDVHQPELVLVGERLDDSLFSDDQVFDPGETVELFFELENLGNLDATMVTGTLTFRGVPPAEVTLVADTAPWPALPIGAREWTSGPRFALEASPAAVLGTEIPLTLSLSVNGRVGPSFPVDIVVGGFPPGQLEWEVRTEELEPMGTGQAVNHPFVIQTNDDDGDGRITACDIPDVIFEVWNLGGVDGFHVLSGDDGRELTSFPVTACRDGWSTFQTFAVGDIDGDGEPELVTDRDNRNACAMELDGSLLWETERVVGFSIFPQPTKIAPNIADVDHDGRAEVIVGHSVIEGEDGTVAWSDLDGGAGGRSIVGDLDLDGELDIIGFEGRVRQADGTDLGTLFPELWKDGGLVQLDDDPEPELVYLGWPSDRVVYIQAREHDGTDIWRHDPPPGLDLRCPPCFGDLDGDGKTEMAQPGGTVMYAVDDDGSFMWSTPIDDSTGASGCSVFDFDLDGRAEVVHRDQRDLRVFLGATGKVLWSAPVSSQTLYECPVIADLDRDGSAEILVHQNLSGNRSIIKSFGNPRWAPARTIWNQENYTVTHVNEDGTPVTDPAPRWINGLDFRGQETCAECDGPELTISLVDLPCGTMTACVTSSWANAVQPVTVTWDFGDGSEPVVDVAPCHLYAAAGRYLIRAYLEDAAGCTREAVLPVDIAEPLVVELTGGPTCDERRGCLVATVSGGIEPYTYEWIFDDAPPVVDGPEPCPFFGGDDWSAWVFITDAQGCLAEAMVSGSFATTVPADVGPVLFGIDHGDPTAALIEGTFTWRGDEGRPRPDGVTYRLIRSRNDASMLRQIPGTEGYTDTTWVDISPAPAERPEVWFFKVFAENECGGVSEN